MLHQAHTRYFQNRMFGEGQNLNAPHYAVFSNRLTLSPPWNTLNLPSSLNVEDQARHPHFTIRQIIVHLSVSLWNSARWNHRVWTLQNVHFMWNGINEGQHFLWWGNLGEFTCKGSSTLSAAPAVDMRQQNHTVGGTSDELICRKWNPPRCSCRCVGMFTVSVCPPCNG